MLKPQLFLKVLMRNCLQRPEALLLVSVIGQAYADLIANPPSMPENCSKKRLKEYKNALKEWREAKEDAAKFFSDGRLETFALHINISARAIKEMLNVSLAYEPAEMA